MAAALSTWFAEGLRHWGRVIGALTLCACLLIGGCATAASLSGNYEQDTVSVADALIATIALPADDPGRADAETSARSLINDYMARYRPRREVNGLASFTTMQTALNSLAGHYSNYPNRPLPEALKDRVTRELQKAEAGVVRGA